MYPTVIFSNVPSIAQSVNVNLSGGGYHTMGDMRSSSNDQRDVSGLSTNCGIGRTLVFVLGGAISAFVTGFGVTYID